MSETPKTTTPTPEQEKKKEPTKVENDLDAAFARLEREKLPDKDWKDLFATFVRAGRTCDSDLLPFLPHLPADEIDLTGCLESTDILLRQAVTAHPDCRVLKLDLCKRITEDGFRFASTSLPKLEVFSFRFGRTTEKALQTLITASWPLKSLSLSGLFGLTEGVLVKIISHFTGLEQVELSHCRNGIVTSNVIKRIGHDLPNVVSLGLSFTSDYGDYLGKLVKRCLKLKTLNIADSKTTDSTLIKLLSACPGITNLDISNCSVVLSNGNIDKLASKLSNIHSLTIGSQNLTDQVLVKIVQSCGNALEELDICGSHKLTAEGLKAVLESAKALKVLNIGSCKFIGEKTVNAIKETNPSLHVFHVPSKST